MAAALSSRRSSSSVSSRLGRKIPCRCCAFLISETTEFHFWKIVNVETQKGGAWARADFIALRARTDVSLRPRCRKSPNSPPQRSRQTRDEQRKENSGMTRRRERSKTEKREEERKNNKERKEGKGNHEGNEAESRREQSFFICYMTMKKFVGLV